MIPALHIEKKKEIKQPTNKQKTTERNKIPFKT